MGNIACLEFGWWRHRSHSPSNIEGEYAWVYMPHVPNHPSGSAEARAAEDAWEKRSLEMHAAQQPIEMPDKPVERSRMRSAVAEFDVVHGDAESPERPIQRTLRVPKFHESPASTETQRRIKRSD